MSASPQPSGWRRALGTLTRTALLPVRSATRLYQSGRAHQHFFLPVLNGALGDQLAAHHDARAIQLSFRRGGHDVPVADLHLSEPRQKTVVFVHGLMGDELIWQTDFEAAASAGSALRYGPRLAAEAGLRVLYVRYNTGLHISENGRALSQLLTDLLAAYPDAIGELVLVGHSMGGLVARSAGYYASQLGGLNSESGVELKASKHRTKQLKTHNSELKTPAGWLAHLRAVFLLGVPNEGSYLEQNGLLVERLLRRIDLFPTRFLSEAIARRSNGIKDLGLALLVDADWQKPDPDPAQPCPRTVVPLLPSVRYHVLVGTWLRASLPQAVRDYFGDGLVGCASAQGQLFSDETALPPGTSVRTARFEAQHHVGLLHHPEVYQYLRQWV
jgi:pimeloyl-ACP methyl ester carboxylesterase